MLRSPAVILMILISLTACLAAGDPATPTLKVNRVSTSAPALPSPSATPTAVPTQPPAPTPEPLPTQPAPAAGLGWVSGSLCYPSYLPPPMTLYLENKLTGDAVKVDTAKGQETFTLELPPGEYVAYAHTVGTELAGTYSEAVVCGLRRHCTDRSLRPFQVEAGQVITGIDLCDWYLPPETIPGPEDAPPQVMITTLQNMNIYTSPTLLYPPVEILPPRTAAQALARTADQLWLQIAYPPEGTAWLYAPLLQISGGPDRLPAITPTLPLEPPPQTQFVPALRWPTSPNSNVVHFKGTIKDTAGRWVNGFAVLLENGTWSVLSHPAGASHHYPDVPEGNWDLIIHNATDATGWWVLTVVSYDCPDFEGGFNAQCKQFTRLSEPQVVKIIYPEQTSIQADWICQRDCDQGLYQEPYRP